VFLTLAEPRPGVPIAVDVLEVVCRAGDGLLFGEEGRATIYSEFTAFN
jgi:hypothetical protein